jgi:hypothetical protein
MKDSTRWSYIFPVLDPEEGLLDGVTSFLCWILRKDSTRWSYIFPVLDPEEGLDSTELHLSYVGS